MKKLIISILIIFSILTLSIPVFCDDGYDDSPVGETFSPTITADSLEDFSEKLQNLKADDIEAYYYKYPVPDIYEKVLKRIDSGEDFMYIPDVDCEIKTIKTYVFALQVYPETYRYEYSKYRVAINSDDEVALDTKSIVEYDGTEVLIAYDSMVFRVEHQYEMGYYEKISLHDLELYYDVYSGLTEFLFRYGKEPLGIRIYKELTEEEIKALPKGMFHPRVISIADIKNGNYTNSVDLIVDDPKESNNIECIIESEY